MIFIKQSLIHKVDLDDLHVTLDHMSTCLPKDVKYTKSKYGGSFTKGNRSIFVKVDFYTKQKVTDPMKIKKYHGKYGVKVHRLNTCDYVGIKKLVQKGLGVK